MAQCDGCLAAFTAPDTAEAFALLLLLLLLLLLHVRMWPWCLLLFDGDRTCSSSW
jgi:hypothetical protein